MNLDHLKWENLSSSVEEDEKNNKPNEIIK